MSLTKTGKHRRTRTRNIRQSKDRERETRGRGGGKGRIGEGRGQGENQSNTRFLCHTSSGEVYSRISVHRLLDCSVPRFWTNKQQQRKKNTQAQSQSQRELKHIPAPNSCVNCLLPKHSTEDLSGEYASVYIQDSASPIDQMPLVQLLNFAGYQWQEKDTHFKNGYLLVALAVAGILVEHVRCAGLNLSFKNRKPKFLSWNLSSELPLALIPVKQRKKWDRIRERIAFRKKEMISIFKTFCFFGPRQHIFTHVHTCQKSPWSLTELKDIS